MTPKIPLGQTGRHKRQTRAPSPPPSFVRHAQSIYQQADWNVRYATGEATCRSNALRGAVSCSASGDVPARMRENPVLSEKRCGDQTGSRFHGGNTACWLHPAARRRARLNSTAGPTIASPESTVAAVWGTLMAALSSAARVVIEVDTTSFLIPTRRVGPSTPDPVGEAKALKAPAEV